MGCGCKNEVEESLSGSTTNKEKLNFDQKAKNFLLRENKFSLIGLFLFITILPIVLAIILPIIVILLFNKFVLGKNTDIIKLIAFKKTKK